MNKAVSQLSGVWVSATPIPESSNHRKNFTVFFTLLLFAKMWGTIK
jgi:hypothetical protein